MTSDSGVPEPSTPLAQIIPSDISAIPTDRYSVTVSISSTIWLHNRALERYNAHLASFTKMLTNHINSIDILISTTERIQKGRYAGKRIVSHPDDEETRKLDLQTRIQRLKLSGWERRAFDATKYQELSRLALSEL